MPRENNGEAPLKRNCGARIFKPRKQPLWSDAKPLSSPLLRLLFAILASILILAPVLIGHHGTHGYGLLLCACGIVAFFAGALIVLKLAESEKHK